MIFSYFNLEYAHSHFYEMLLKFGKNKNSHDFIKFARQNYRIVWNKSSKMNDKLSEEDY